MKKISKDKKKGKLTKDEDQKEIKIDREVYYKMFSNLGGIWLLIPFVAAISLFSYLEIYREKEIKRWANKIAKE